MRMLLLSVPLLLCGCLGTQGGNVLVFPGEYSHWLNMRVILEELVERNHSVTVLVSTASPSVDFSRPEKFGFKVYNVPHEKQDWQALNDGFIKWWMNESHNTSMLQLGQWIRDFMQKMNVLTVNMCKSMFNDKELLESLKLSKFDALLSDPMFPCSDLIADALDLPLIFSLRFSFGMVLERQCAQMPAPSSYVPSPELPYTDKMSFFERVHNFVTYTFFDIFMSAHLLTTMDTLYSEIKGKLIRILSTSQMVPHSHIVHYFRPRTILFNFTFI